MSLTAQFDWPPKELSPNSRCHWAKKAKAAKGYRKDCHILALMQKLSVDWEGSIHVHLAFLPPDNRSRDRDNLQASAKSGLDGLADALGVNDRRFFAWSTIGAVQKGGKVLVTLSRGV